LRNFTSAPRMRIHWNNPDIHGYILLFCTCVCGGTCVCLCLCLCLWRCLCLCLRLCLCMTLCIYANVCVPTSKHSFVFVREYMCIPVYYTHIGPYICIQVRRETSIHPLTHTHTHIHTHTAIRHQATRQPQKTWKHTIYTLLLPCQPLNTSHSNLHQPVRPCLRSTARDSGMPLCVRMCTGIYVCVKSNKVGGWVDG